MFKLMMILCLVFGFAVPYVSADSVGKMESIAIQLVIYFFAFAYWKMED